MDKPKRWLRRTHQGWKVTVFVAGETLFGGALCYQLLRVGSASERGISSTLVATLGGLLSFVLLATCVRCPECGRRVAWFVLRTASAGQWLQTLLKLEECPCCERARPDALFGAVRRQD